MLCEQCSNLLIIRLRGNTRQSSDQLSIETAESNAVVDELLLLKHDDLHRAVAEKQ